MTYLPQRSIISVSPSLRSSIVSESPKAIIRPSLMAAASAAGRSGFCVMMTPLYMIISAFFVFLNRPKAMMTSAKIINIILP